MDSANLLKKFIGIDIGGTGIKGIIIRGDGEEICRGSIPTDVSSGEALCDCIVTLINKLLSEIGGYKMDIKGVGIGCPGLIDSKNGVVVFAGNLNLSYYSLGDAVSEKVGLPVRLTNDANAAALGEAKFGAGKKYDNSILVTLGTGIGGGIVIDGKIFEGGKSAGAEIGHMVIERGGRFCTCGRRGCFEAYCSARALENDTREAMEDDTGSAMWKTYTNDTVSGKTAFEYMDVDRTAKKVADRYINYLACGLTNLAALFRPQAIMIGGGVSAQGTRLTEPLQKLVNAELFGGTEYAPVEIVSAKLGHKAGAYGAAALCMD